MSGEVEPNEPIDADVDLRVGSQRGELSGHHATVLGVIALGGGLGALARYELARLMPTPADRFPWSTFTTNVLGCLLIGILMVLVTEALAAHRLVRPFLGVGVLGGFTTFSTYASEIHTLLRPGTAALAFAYLAGTLVAAVLATFVGMWTTRAVIGRREPATV